MNKAALLEHLKMTLDARMQAAWKAMEAAQESANEQGKSSMGDKYETSRSMGQLDRDMFARQYESARQERVLLERINPNEVTERVALGSLVNTTAGRFIVAVSLGKISYEDETVMAVSSSSPIGVALMGKSSGDTFSFMGKNQHITGLI
ncbi:hypothetical protein DYBT9275_01014 [Dyadobacter sp. CECT 9275]|uniref:Transcription elongation factor n=2 Tax=Dyadobacter helix TaxID=2822344 RepID=A0A916NB87_9BACT|nr:hypothetical protein DYBT9275_01014 [Dyadobacter sp. CECT 9275]